MNAFTYWRHIALVLGVVSPWLLAFSARAEEGPCFTCPAGETASPSWIFRRSTYSHDPYTGARVAQYMRTPPVEPLEDERLVTSRYRRSRTNLRGTDGSRDTYYEVQAWGNGRGGIDAEWERFHDAWKESYLSGGYYNQGAGYGPWGFAPGFGGFPGYGFPSYGFPPGYGHPQPGPPHGHFDDDDGDGQQNDSNWKKD
jgi:hypothetical protein